MCIIYLLTNKINGKNYVGVTNNFLKRMKEHQKAKNCIIDRAIKKYGWNNFTSQILDETVDYKYGVNILEPFYIKKYQSKIEESGYNLTNGGQGTQGFVVSPQTKKLQSMAKKGKKLSKETIAKMIESRKWYSHSQKTRNKIAKKLKGNTNFSGHTFTSEIINILSQKKSKNWIVISPDNQQQTITNLRQFCLQHNLHPSAMCRVAKGIAQHHKGWKVIQCPETPCKDMS